MGARPCRGPEKAEGESLALAPWPTSPVALENARAHLARHIGKQYTLPATADQIAEGNAILDDVGSAAAAYVERYAPGAPDAVKDESVVRFAAWLVTVTDALTRERDGEMEQEFDNNHAAMFRRSGAAALLSPWKIRRAGVIG